MARTSSDGPPNILFILADQLRADFVSCYGAGFIDTPHIDGIAAAGIRYERAYSASPLCVPARTALLTGMSAARTGVADNLHALRPDYREAGIGTWPELLARAGYHTAAIGKMHFYPWDAAHGFHERVACEDKLWPLIRDDYARYLEAHWPSSAGRTTAATCAPAGRRPRTSRGSTPATASRGGRHAGSSSGMQARRPPGR